MVWILGFQESLTHMDPALERMVFMAEPFHDLLCKHQLGSLLLFMETENKLGHSVI